VQVEGAIKDWHWRRKV